MPNCVYPWCLGPHCTTPALAFPRHHTWVLPAPVHTYYWHLAANTGDLFKLVHLRTPPLVVTSGGQHWRPVQTCTIEDPQSDIWWWPLKNVQFASGRFASDWNAYSLRIVFFIPENIIWSRSSGPLFTAELWVSDLINELLLFSLCLRYKVSLRYISALSKLSNQLYELSPV